MSDAGYTLAEALVALVIVGFAVGGVAEGASVIGRMHASATGTLGRGERLAEADRAMAGLFAGQGPFNSIEPGVQGDDQGFGFDCQSQRCGASLSQEGSTLTLKVSRGAAGEQAVVLPGITAARFSYVSDHSVGAVWPPASSDRKEHLRSIAVIGVTPGGDAPVAVTRMWLEQPHVCQFDFVAQDCRTATG